MRRIGVVLGVAAVMAAAVALTAGAALAQAEAETINERIPFTEEGAINVNECTGEPIALEGTVHIVGHVTLTENGRIAVFNHFNVQGQGVSPSGAKYVITNVDQVVETVHEGSTHTVSTRLKLLRQGEDGTEEDLIAQSIFHVTQNANGEWTAEVYMPAGECR